MNSFIQFFASFFVGLLIVEPFSLGASPVLSQMQDFLNNKSSPIPAYELIKYDNWKMIVALSAAESTYGQNMAGTFNAWGIKDFRSGSNNFRGTRNFESWDESVNYVSDLLYLYDPLDGAPEASDMVEKWKYVKPYQPWINNVEYSLRDINRNITAKEVEPYILLPIK